MGHPWPEFAVIGSLGLVVILWLDFWVLAVVSLRKAGIWRVFGLLAFQLSLVMCLITWVLSLNIFAGLIVAALGPLALTMAIVEFWPFGKFVFALALWTAPVVLAAFAICLARPILRDWSVAIPSLLGLAIVLPVGEWQSRRTMCEAASRLGFNEFQRNSFVWSLRNGGQEFQWDIHALAVVDGQRLGWSYREMDWYVVPDDAWGEVKGPVFNCATDL